MGYQRTFKPTEEAVKKLRDKIIKINSIDDAKLELYLYCMKDHSDDNMREVIFKIKSLLQEIKYYAVSNEYKYAVDCYDTDSDKMIWWCGWQYSHSQSDDTYESVIRYCTDRLSEMAILTKTPDWYDDNEKYCLKANEINEVIKYFEKTIQEVTAYEIFNELKEFDITAKADE